MGKIGFRVVRNCFHLRGIDKGKELLVACFIKNFLKELFQVEILNLVAFLEAELDILGKFKLVYAHNLVESAVQTGNIFLDVVSLYPMD